MSAGTSGRRRAFRWAHLTVVALFTFFLAFPFYWMLITSFKRTSDLYDLKNNPLVFNEAPTLDHWKLLFSETLYGRWLGNTALIGVLVVAITLLLAVPAAYSLARLTGKWGERAGIGMFLMYLVPPTLLFIPLSRVVVTLGVQDSIWALVLVYPTFTMPFSTWLLMGFFKTIPPELEDAALVDGASRLKALVRVVFPISLPGILTVVIFSFSLVVNDFVYSLAFITTSSAKTISTGVFTELIRGDIFFWQGLMAATLLPSIPLALLYNVFLNRFIAGFTGGAFR